MFHVHTKCLTQYWAELVCLDVCVCVSLSLSLFPLSSSYVVALCHRVFCVSVYAFIIHDCNGYFGSSLCAPFPSAANFRSIRPAPAMSRSITPGGRRRLSRTLVFGPCCCWPQLSSSGDMVRMDAFTP